MCRIVGGKVLEDTNIKLFSVATDVVGNSGWDMLKHIVAGESDAEKMADLARGRLKSKREDLVLALEGRVTEHHRFMLRQHIHQIEFLDIATGEYDQCIEEQTRPFDEYLPLLDTIPVSNPTAACALFAELGANTDQSPDEHHLSSWGGDMPGNQRERGQASQRKNTTREQMPAVTAG